MSSTELQAPGPTSTPNAQTAPASSNGRAFLARNDDLVREARELLRERLEEREDADPRASVDEFLRELIVAKRHDLLVQAAREGLIQWSWDFIKKNTLNDPQSMRHQPASGKWDDVAAAVREHRDIFEVTVWTGTTRKYLGDCTKAELAVAAELREKQAATLIDNADRLRKLSRKLKADQVVRDLDRQVVEDVFNA